MQGAQGRLHDAIKHQLNLASGSMTWRSRSSKAFGLTAPMKRLPGGPSSTWPLRSMPAQQVGERVQRVAPGDERQVAGHGVSPRRSVGCHRRVQRKQHRRRDRHAHQRRVPRSPRELPRIPPHESVIVSPRISPGPPIACRRAATRVASASRNPPSRSHTVPGGSRSSASRSKRARWTAATRAVADARSVRSPPVR